MERQKGTLIVALGLVAAAQTAPLAVLPLLMEVLALGADELGVALAAGLLTTLALAPIAGRLSDRLPPARLARCGLAMTCTAAGLLCGYAAMSLKGSLPREPAFAVLLTTRIINGVGVAALHPSAQNWLWSGASDEEGALLQGWASATQNAGRLLGPMGVALGGGLGVAWTLAGLVAIGVSALICLVLTPSPLDGGGGTAQRINGSALDPLPNGGRSLLAALLALHLLGGSAQFLLGPLLLALLDFSAPDASRWAGWLMALAAVASILGNLIGRRMRGRRRAMAGAGLAATGAIVLVPFADVASVAGGVAAVAAGIGTAVPSVIAELMRRSPLWARGRAAGRTTAIQAGAYAAAAPAFGILFSASPELAAAMLPMPAAAACLILAVANRKEPDWGIDAYERPKPSAEQ